MGEYNLDNLSEEQAKAVRDLLEERISLWGLAMLWDEEVFILSKEEDLDRARSLVNFGKIMTYLEFDWEKRIYTSRGNGKVPILWIRKQ